MRLDNIHQGVLGTDATYWSVVVCRSNPPDQNYSFGPSTVMMELQRIYTLAEDRFGRVQTTTSNETSRSEKELPNYRMI